MDRSANQSRLSRAQLPPREAGSAALSLDQLTDLDQAINLSRGDRPAKSTPTPIVAHSAPKPIASPLSSPAANSSISPKPASKPAKPTESPAPEPPVVPVRSAKEAINAMYSSENPARLSDYLGASAKEIINATHSGSEGRDTKSASSLHHASSQRKIEAARPSASAIFRAAKSEKSAPVVHTSLELDPKSPKISKPAPKQTPIVINSRTRAENSRLEAARPAQVSSVRPKKGQIKITTPSPTSIAVSAIEDAVASASPKAAKISKPSASVKSPKTPVPKPAQVTASPRRPQYRRPGCRCFFRDCSLGRRQRPKPHQKSVPEALQIYLRKIQQYEARERPLPKTPHRFCQAPLPPRSERFRREQARAGSPRSSQVHEF